MLIFKADKTLIVQSNAALADLVTLECDRHASNVTVY